jgi:regulator of RNase E activity RraB
MMQHIHYGDWTIEWCDSDYGYDFAIGNGGYRMDWRGVEPLYLEIGSFTLAEYGIDASKRLISDIIDRQKNVAIRVIEEYVKQSSGYTASIEEPPASDEEDSDNVPF